MPMIHTCARPGCETLTMGEVCLQHERLAASSPRGRLRRALPRAAAAAMLVAAAAAGALVGARLPR